MNAADVFAMKEQMEQQQRLAEQWQDRWQEATRQAIGAQRVLARIAELCDIADAAAEASLQRMFGGHPFPAALMVADVRAAMAEQ